MIRQPNSSTSHKKRTLTPAAQSLMRRMSSTRRNTPFEVKDGPKRFVCLFEKRNSRTEMLRV